MKKYRIFALNPGSTSTKIALFENDEAAYIGKVVHEAADLARFAEINDQFEYRRDAILDVLRREGVSLEGIDAISTRGGGVPPCEGGTYVVDQALSDYCANSLIRHPASIGPRIALDFSLNYNVPAFLVNPPDVDELDDVARVTGFSDIFRTSNTHALNQKETSIRAAKEMGKAYENCNFVVAHIGGGVSVTAHRRGREVDSNTIINGEGPLTPTRAGSLPTVLLLDMCFSGKYTRDELYNRMTKSGGFVDHLGTSEVLDVLRMIEDGNKYAKLVYDSFVYQIGKEVGSMAAVLHGDIDAILLTGGITNSKAFVAQLSEMIEFIAPIRVYPGEFEMEALASGAVRVLAGEEAARPFMAEPVFTSFDHLKPL